MKTSFHSLIHFLPFLLNYLRLPSPELDPILKRPSLFLYNPSARTTRKTQLLYCLEGLLLIRCLAVDVLLLRAYAFAWICLPSRCLAMGLFVRILIICFIDLCGIWFSFSGSVFSCYLQFRHCYVIICC
jgi:hypothetical protein